jgi:acyl dehydratase
LFGPLLAMGWWTLSIILGFLVLFLVRIGVSIIHRRLDWV